MRRKRIQAGRAAATMVFIATLAMLGGCTGSGSGRGTAGSGGTVTTTPTRQGSQATALAHGAMARGPMLVVIEGTPYAVQDQAFADRVLDDMRSAMTWTTPRLTADPAAAITPSLRVVMTFNSSIGDAITQCRGGTHGGGPADQGAVQVTSSFCSNGDVISSTSGHLDRSSGPDDPQFSSLIAKVVDDLFQQQRARSPDLGIGIGGGFGAGRGGISGTNVGIGIGF